MKSKGRIIAAAVMLPIVIIVSALSVKYSPKSGRKIYFVFGGNVQLRNTVEIPLSDIDSLQVSYTSNNLEVYPTEGDRVIIKEYLISKEKDALADVEIDDHAAVVTGGKTVAFTIFGFFTGLERIELYIPKEGIDRLSLQTTSGNITAKDGFSLETEKLEVMAKSGNIKWFDSGAEEMEIQAGSGNILLERISGKAMVQTGSGNITVREWSGEGSVQAGSGNIKAEASKVTGNIRVKTGSGGIHLTLPEEQSFQMEIQTGSGGIHTSFDDALSYNKKGNQAKGIIGENPSCLIYVEANSGNVHITAE